MAGPDLDALAAAGLYDPEMPRAQERLELLEWLLDQGFTIDEMRAAQEQRALTTMAGDRALRAEERYSMRDLVEMTGHDRGRIASTIRAVGSRAVDDDTAVFTETDVDALRTALAAEGIFPREAVLRIGRTISASMARIADAANSLFVADVEAALIEEGRSELELAEANLRAVSLLEGLTSTFASVFRGQMEDAIDMSRRARGGVDRQRGSDLSRLAVGFVDLTGYTSLSSALDARSLAALVDRFEAVANEATMDGDARVVKLVGDEVMYVAVSPHDAVAVAQDLLGAFSSRADVTAHGGIAYGEVLSRGGDYYGPVVNLAARLSERAVPGEVLVTHEVAEHVGGLEPAGRRMLKGFEDPVVLWALTLATRPGRERS